MILIRAIGNWRSRIFESRFPQKENSPVSRNQLLFSVIDTGIGIAATDLNRLFQTFKQRESRLDRRHEGIGQVLALSHRLAALMSGEIIVVSKLRQEGCFRLR